MNLEYFESSKYFRIKDSMYYFYEIQLSLWWECLVDLQLVVWCLSQISLDITKIPENVWFVLSFRWVDNEVQCQNVLHLFHQIIWKAKL